MVDNKTDKLEEDPDFKARLERLTPKPVPLKPIPATIRIKDKEVHGNLINAGGKQVLVPDPASDEEEPKFINVQGKTVKLDEKADE